MTMKRCNVGLLYQ